MVQIVCASFELNVPPVGEHIFGNSDDCCLICCRLMTPKHGRMIISGAQVWRCIPRSSHQLLSGRVSPRQLSKYHRLCFNSDEMVDF